MQHYHPAIASKDQPDILLDWAVADIFWCASAIYCQNAIASDPYLHWHIKRRGFAWLRAHVASTCRFLENIQLSPLSRLYVTRVKVQSQIWSCEHPLGI